MFKANYPVIGRQECYPFYLSGIGVSSPEFHTVREKGLISHQILFTLEGTGKILIDGKEYISKKGGIFYVESGVPHEYYPIGEKWTTCWMVFRGDNLREIMHRMGFSRYLYGTTENLQEVKNLFEKIEFAAEKRGGSDEYCSVLLYQYIMLMYKILIMDNKNYTETIVDNAVDYIENYYGEDISLQKLAELCGISMQHFCRVFHQKIGMRPLEYIARKRISQAKVELYGTDKKIAQIGEEVGYSDANYFGIVFKKYEGVSPREFRQGKNLAKSGALYQ